MRGFRGPLPVMLAAALACAAEEPTAEEIVAEFKGIRIPWGFGMTEEEYEKLVRERCGRQCALARELAQRFPSHEAVPELMGLRWTMLLTVFDDPARVLEETASAPERLFAEAALAAAYATLEAPDLPAEASAEAGAAPGAPANEKLKRLRVAAGAAKSERQRELAAFLLVEFARSHVANPRRQREICEKVVEEYPRAAADAREMLKALERVGKVLEVPEGRPLVEAERGEAEYVLVHFFSAFDSRIRKDLRELREGVARLPAGRVRVEGVMPFDDEMQRERARELERECGMRWPVRLAPEDGAEVLKGGGWWSRLRLGQASFVLLDRERRVVALAGRPAPLLEALARVKRSAPGD